MGGLTLAAGFLILLGLVGIAVPVLPGLTLVWAGVLLWSIGTGTTAGWVVLGVATVLALAGFTLQYVAPGRRLRAAGVTTSTTVAAVLLGIVGFFVVPVVGAVLGFVLGVYLAERAKLGAHQQAWPRTKQALAAVGLGIGIQLATGLAITAAWVAGLLVAG